MRKILCVLTVLVLCLTLAAPVFATQESTFVPSITYKPNPELVEVPGADGKYHAGVIRDLDGNIIDYIDLGCLRLTPSLISGMRLSAKRPPRKSSTCCSICTMS